MSIPDLQTLLENKIIISAVSVLGGALIGSIATTLRNRVKVIEYTVAHDRVGLSADDAIFGSVRVTWQGNNLTNLYSSIVTIENSTSTDFTNLSVSL